MANTLLMLIRRKAIESTVICIDPGKRTGWALIEMGVITKRGTVDARSILPPADAALVEMPRVYANPVKWKGDPQDIAKLAAMAGEYAGRYRMSELVEPRAWRGNIPEAVLLARLKRSLLPDEALGASVHARDAQGMALWLLGRLK
jgi:hypothetical protein